MFINVFTTALHWSLSWARSIWSIKPHPIALRSTLILSAQLCHQSSSDFFPSGFPAICMHSTFPHSCYMPCPCHPPWFGHSNFTWRIQVMKLLIMQFSPTCCHLSSLFSTVPSNTLSLFSSLKARGRVSHWHNHIFRQRTRRQKLYKHTTQKLYICDPQTQLTTSLLFQKISLHVSAPTGHLPVIFLKISYSTATHPLIPSKISLHVSAPTGNLPVIFLCVYY
jgi:hypothetical protein